MYLPGLQIEILYIGAQAHWGVQVSIQPVAVLLPADPHYIGGFVLERSAANRTNKNVTERQNGAISRQKQYKLLSPLCGRGLELAHSMPCLIVKGD